MKKLLFPLLFAGVVAIAACSPQGGKSTDPALAAAVKAKLESREFEVYMDTAIPRRGRTVTLTTPYNIRIAGDSIYSYLPYFGEAYTAVIGRQEGLIFDGPVTGYKVTEGKRGAIEIRFSARTFEDSYDYSLAVYPNGHSSLIVNPNRKSSISFDGKLKLDDE